MELPKRDIGPWAKDLIDQCLVSRPQRSSQCKMWRDYYFNGSNSGQAIYNNMYNHIERLASYLFSPADVQFALNFDRGARKELLDRALIGAKYLTSEYHVSMLDTAFAQSVKWGLIKGTTLLKNVWSHNGFDPYVVHPESFGVLREDLNGLDRQEAFVHVMYLTPGQFATRVKDHPERQQLIDIAKATANVRADNDSDSNYLKQIVIGGTNPVTTTPPGASNGGIVNVFNTPTPMLAPDVAGSLIEFFELWVLDDEREDWTTIQMINEQAVVEGKLKRRNLSGIPNETGFTQVCPNIVDGYFWGMPEPQVVQPLQDMLNNRLFEFDRLSKLRSNTPKGYIGFSGMNEDKHTALNVPGGWIAEDQPNAKIEDLKPELPPEMMEAVNQAIKWMDDAAGFQNVMKGEGETGVRAGAHADTLVRTASPRLRDRALLVEKQCAESANFAFKVLQAKIPEAFITPSGEEFLLSQLPLEGWRAQVDSHSGSPAFTESGRELAFALFKSGAIDGPDLVLLTHPPYQDMLILRAKERDAAKAKMIQEHPELLTKGKKR